MPLDPARRPQRGVAAASSLGIRPEAFEDGGLRAAGHDRRSTSCRTVVEELGSDAHVLLPCRRARRRRPTSAAATRRTLLAESKALFTRPGRPARPRAASASRSARRRPGALPLLRPRDAARPSCRDAAGAQAPAPRAGGGGTVTKQSETPGPGARPDRAARRRRSDPVRAPAERRPRRVAPDRPRRARRPRPRGLPRPPARLRHVRERAEDRAGADDDLVHRGHAPPRDGARRAARSSSRSSRPGARLGRFLHVSPSEPVVVAKRLRLADRETMAIETLHVREALVPGLTGRRSRGPVVLRAAARALRDRDRRAACRRSSRR